MTFRQLYDYCRSKPGSEESFPFDETTLVFKVRGKMFALTDVERLPLSVSLKCDPGRAVALRERYASVSPGYHLSKRHWNTIELDGDVEDAEVCAWIDHSYELVVAGLRRAERETLTTHRAAAGESRG